MTNNFSVLFKKYSVPGLLLILGLALLIVGIMKKQDMMFMLSSVLMFVAGGLSLLYSSGKFKTMILVIFGALAGIVGIVLLAMSWTQVSSEMAWQAKVDLMEKTSKQNLEDIIYIQKEYQDRNGVYCGSWDKLIDFVKNGTVDYINSDGRVPGRKLERAESNYLYNDNRALDNNMTEVEAHRLSKWKTGPNWKKDFSNFKRDTTQVSLLTSKFKSKPYLEARKITGIGEFYPDSLRFIPFTKGKREWYLATKDSVDDGSGVKLPAVRVEGILPFTKKKMFFGSLTTPNQLDGSWQDK